MKARIINTADGRIIAYKQQENLTALKKIAEIDMLTENGIIICESPADKVLPELPQPYQKGREYRYGKIKITVYRKEV